MASQQVRVSDYMISNICSNGFSLKHLHLYRLFLLYSIPNISDVHKIKIYHVITCDHGEKFILHNDEAPHWMHGFRDCRHVEERTHSVHGMTEDRYCSRSSLSALWDIHNLQCKMTRCFSGSRCTSLTV